ncbi:hypothetical protein G6W61_27885 [Streptomyces sp. KAI-26]|uniref:hypothetical protein n=1 Tax=Streptomyces sp. KAI-26 TaxID=1169747 RepID=UPI00158726FA|nr:hypothetical protein [Streptomyces sp. KAI-26]NUV89985.1 hypothetical protein [Streptomyces sp. KAI-26]NUW23999.1 hypothetical protein [Streptomyces roseoviolaceus]
MTLPRIHANSGQAGGELFRVKKPSSAVVATTGTAGLLGLHIAGFIPPQIGLAVGAGTFLVALGLLIRGMIVRKALDA